MRVASRGSDAKLEGEGDSEACECVTVLCVTVCWRKGACCGNELQWAKARP